jgi:hypothetical protein
MTISKGELIGFLAWLLMCAFEFDGPEMWFAVFGAVVFKWFAEPIADWYADRWVAKRIEEIRAECWK